MGCVWYRLRRFYKQRGLAKVPSDQKKSRVTKDTHMLSHTLACGALARAPFARVAHALSHVHAPAHAHAHAQMHA